jgi:hypothetical protein
MINMLRVIVSALAIEEIDIGHDVNSSKQAVDEFVEATNGNALETVVEIVVVVDKTDRQTLDDESRELATLSTPLLLGVALDEDFVNILTNEQLGLLLQITGLGDTIGLHALKGFLTLFGNLSLGLSRGQDAPHLIEGVHIEGQVILLAFVIGYRGIGITVELDNGIGKVPDLLVGGMEDMGAILMDIDTLDVLTIDITTQMVALVDDQTLLAVKTGHAGKSGTIDAGSNNQIVVTFLHIHTIFLQKYNKIWNNQN